MRPDTTVTFFLREKQWKKIPLQFLYINKYIYKVCTNLPPQKNLKNKNKKTKGALAAKIGTDEHILLLFYNLSISAH